MTPPDAMTLVPPRPAYEGEPPPTADDPTADGYFCGAQRKAGQIEADREAGIEHPWPWCRLRAGWGTDHPKIGACKLHGGSTPNARVAAQIRLREMVGPAMAALAKILTDPTASEHAKIRAVENVLDRAGYPRRFGLDPDAARESLVARISDLVASGDADN